jgi:hypothetical protein
MKLCQICSAQLTESVYQYSEEELQHLHEVVVHNKCEVCSEFFDNSKTRNQHLAEEHGKMYLSSEEPYWPDGLSELVDIPRWQPKVSKPENTPAQLPARQVWLMPFALAMVEEAAAGRAENLLRSPPSELRDRAQYVSWVQIACPRSADAWKLARYRNQQRSKNAKAKFLARAWAFAEVGRPTYLKEKGY